MSTAPLQPTRSHNYVVDFYGVPTAEEVEEEIARARTVFGVGMRMRFSSHDDQRDGYSLKITFTAPVGRQSSGMLPPQTLQGAAREDMT